jgi:predicted DNA-binding transcriptional regulator YafY
VAPQVLTTLATACRDQERLRFDYVDHTGTVATRVVEPHRLVVWGRRWYLVAWDIDRHDWRTFRVDRLTPRPPTGPRFAARDLPGDGDLAAYVARRVSSAGFRFRARVKVHAPAEVVAARINPAVGIVEAIDEQTCVLATGGESVDSVAVYIGLLGLDFSVLDPPELVEALRTLVRRYQAAIGST